MKKNKIEQLEQTKELLYEMFCSICIRGIGECWECDTHEKLMDIEEKIEPLK